MRGNNTIQVAFKLIQAINVPVTLTSVKEEFSKHPEYNSLLGISDVLNTWWIPNEAYGLSFEELMAADLPVPFVAYVTQDEDGYMLVNEIAQNQVIVSNETWDRHVLKTEEFKALYKGYILIAEKDTHSGESDYSRKRRKELLNNLRPIFVAVGVIAIFISTLVLKTAYFSTINLQLSLLSIFKTVGTTIAILLLMQNIDAENPLIKRLCNNKSGNCNAVLSSKASKISNEFSWSEAGFFYFSGTWLVLLFNSNNHSLLQLLAILNVASLPYTFYSIYHQGVVIKQWCVFCCTIQAILWLEFFSFLPFLLEPIHLADRNLWGTFMTTMALPVLIWIFVKPYIQKLKQIPTLTRELEDFRYNSSVFKNIINQEPRYALLSDEDSIILGNKASDQIITFVSNPYCQPCSIAHKTIDNWLASRNDLKLQIIFTIHEEDPEARIPGHFFSLQRSQDDHILKLALNNWYDQDRKDYHSWVEKHPSKIHINSFESIKKQREWCETSKITGTPTIFINGRKLPNHYQLNDIKYLI
jgi:uncharacterized membrane protein